jgi:hypothetical protein
MIKYIAFMTNATNTETATSNEVTIDSVLNLSQARKLTGFSVAKFSDKNKAILTELGADFTPELPKNWAIPVKALVEADFLNADLSPKEVRRIGKNKSAKSTTSVATSEELAALDSYIAELEGNLAEAKHRRKEAVRKAAAAEREAAGARAKLEKNAANLRAKAEQLLAEAKAAEDALASL